LVGAACRDDDAEFFGVLEVGAVEAAGVAEDDRVNLNGSLTISER